MIENPFMPKEGEVHYIFPWENDACCGRRGSHLRLTMTQQEVTCDRCLKEIRTVEADANYEDYPGQRIMGPGDDFRLP